MVCRQLFTEFSLILLSQVILYETTWNNSLMFEQNIFLRVCWFMLWVQVTSVSSCQWSDSSLSPCEWLTISYYWKRNILGIHCGQCGYVLFWLEFVKIFNKKRSLDCALFHCKACRMQLEHERSIGKNTRHSQVFLPTSWVLLNCLIRFLGMTVL